nr:isoflavone reductase homolog [Ipomoea batatas]
MGGSGKMGKSKVLIVGGTGYIGRRIVKASLAQGHTTHVLLRPQIGLDIDKLQMLLSFKEQGARLVEASFDDHRSLVDAVKEVDVVICTMSGVHFRSHNILLQRKLVDAIKEAGNIKGMMRGKAKHGHVGIALSVVCAAATERPKNGKEKMATAAGARMGHALEPGRVTFDEKMEVRKAIEEANIPHTYISANCFAAYFCPNLSQLGTLLPPKHKVCIYGDGNAKVAYMDEDDVATYTIKTVDDPRALNKTIYLRPQENILTQRELVATWEKLTGKQLEKITISADEFLASMKDMDYAGQVGVGHFYHIFYEGCLTNFDIGEDAEEASQLYPEVQYIRMHEYLKRYL